jgi:DNA polymerase III subunit chi
VSEAKPAVGFYHLTRDRVDVALPKLLERALKEGHRILVRAATQARVDKLDSALWTYEKDSFLPHGTDRNEAPDLMPILLTAKGDESDDSAGDRSVLVLLDNFLPSDLGRWQRVIYMFDGGSDMEVRAARGHWKDLKARGLPLIYWQQGQAGGWNRAAEG